LKKFHSGDSIEFFLGFLFNKNVLGFFLIERGFEKIIEKFFFNHRVKNEQNPEDFKL